MGMTNSSEKRPLGDGFWKAALRFSAVSVLFLAPVVPAQPGGPSPQDPSVLNSLDSLKRVITRRILSDAEKKEIRSCDREKTGFLTQCRMADTGNAEIDRKITDAKLRGADPNDPAVAALLEGKFAIEKACDDKFTATARGKQCLAGEGKRRAALEKALKKDKQYQALLKKTELAGPEI
jgi:hypothetical protein